MGYVIAGILVLLIVTAFVVFLVLNATRKGAPDPKGAAPPGIGTDDETPLGDTSEHAGEQTREGTTARDPEREGPSRSGSGAAGGEGGVGGEAEGGRPVTPESERLANRPR